MINLLTYLAENNFLIPVATLIAATATCVVAVWAILRNSANVEKQLIEQRRQHQVDLRLERFAEFLEIAVKLMNWRTLRAARIDSANLEKKETRKKRKDGGLVRITAGGPSEAEILNEERQEEGALILRLSQLHSELFLLLRENDPVLEALEALWSKLKFTMLADGNRPDGFYGLNELNALRDAIRKDVTGE